MQRTCRCQDQAFTSGCLQLRTPCNAPRAAACLDGTACCQAWRVTDALCGVLVVPVLSCGCADVCQPVYPSRTCSAWTRAPAARQTSLTPTGRTGASQRTTGRPWQRRGMPGEQLAAAPAVCVLASRAGLVCKLAARGTCLVSSWLRHWQCVLVRRAGLVCRLAARGICLVSSWLPHQQCVLASRGGLVCGLAAVLLGWAGTPVTTRLHAGCWLLGLDLPPCSLGRKPNQGAGGAPRCLQVETAPLSPGAVLQRVPHRPHPGLLQDLGDPRQLRDR